MVSLQLTSSALEPGQPIPKRFTADGEDLSPSLTWSALQDRTQLLSYLFRHRVSALNAEAAVLDFELQSAYQLIDERS